MVIARLLPSYTKDQNATKLKLGKFLAQLQPMDTTRQKDTRPEDEQKYNGDSHSDGEEPYLSNLEKLTDFLISFHNFQEFQRAISEFCEIEL